MGRGSCRRQHGGNGLSASQLFAWRHLAPAIISREPSTSSPPLLRHKRRGLIGLDKPPISATIRCFSSNVQRRRASRRDYLEPRNLRHRRMVSHTPISSLHPVSGKAVLGGGIRRRRCSGRSIEASMLKGAMRETG
jgi:hypothetical protein